jgi:hypothetical protein
LAPGGKSTGLALSTGSTQKDLVKGVYDGTNYWMEILKNNAT